MSAAIAVNARESVIQLAVMLTPSSVSARMGCRLTCVVQGSQMDLLAYPIILVYLVIVSQDTVVNARQPVLRLGVPQASNVSVCTMDKLTCVVQRSQMDPLAYPIILVYLVFVLEVLAASTAVCAPQALTVGTSMAVVMPAMTTFIPDIKRNAVQQVGEDAGGIASPNLSLSPR